MARTKALEHLLRRGLLILLIGLAAALVYLWLFRPTSFNETRAFDRIYQASVIRASGDLYVATALGLPIHHSRDVAQYEFFEKDGNNHVRFKFPLSGKNRRALIVGEAVLLGKNWLIVRLVATFPGSRKQINLTPGILT